MKPGGNTRSQTLWRFTPVRFVYELDNSGKLVNLVDGPQREEAVQNG